MPADSNVDSLLLQQEILQLRQDLAQIKAMHSEWSGNLNIIIIIIIILLLSSFMYAF